MYSSEPLSKDHLKRVYELSKTSGNADSEEGLEHLDSFIYCGDPVIVKIQNRYVISNIVKIKLANKIKKYISYWGAKLSKSHFRYTWT